MKRKLSTAIGELTSVTFLAKRQIIEGKDTIVFRHPVGGVAFMVSPDDLFDAAGNRFENDLPIVVAGPKPVNA